uniref:HTH three-helical bundle domain-containing protein n=1 Tax=Salix viminalis TaxID=40686 RepID=A0A6N2N288_SALVM
MKRILYSTDDDAYVLAEAQAMGHQRTDVVAPLEKAVEASTETGLCLSSPSIFASIMRNHHMKRKGLVMKPTRADEEDPKRITSSSGSCYLCSLAKAILKLLSSGVFSKMRICQVLGDSPSTSKALRMLLRQDVMIWQRRGLGGC